LQATRTYLPASLVFLDFLDFKKILANWQQVCTQYTSYDVTSQTVSYETPVLISGGQVAADPAGGSITAGFTYSKSVGFIGGIQATFN
jgi:hypothetical protein